MVVKARIGKNFEAGADGAALGVVGAVDEAGNAGLNDCAGAHAAGLDGDVQRDVRKAVVAEESCSFTKYDDFGVGGWIIVTDGAVAGVGENLSVMDEHGADGYFTGASGSTGFSECFLHELEVRFHLRREDSMGKEKKRN